MPPDARRDAALAGHVLGLSTACDSAPAPATTAHDTSSQASHRSAVLPAAQLRDYIAWAKATFRPALEPDAQQLLLAYYQRQRHLAASGIGSGEKVTVRFLEALVRLTQAHARLMARGAAAVSDAAAVLMLVDTCAHVSSIFGLAATQKAHCACDLGDAAHAEAVQVVLRQLDINCTPMLQNTMQASAPEQPVLALPAAAASTDALALPGDRRPYQAELGTACDAAVQQQHPGAKQMSASQAASTPRVAAACAASFGQRHSAPVLGVQKQQQASNIRPCAHVHAVRAPQGSPGVSVGAASGASGANAWLQQAHRHGSATTTATQQALQQGRACHAPSCQHANSQQQENVHQHVGDRVLNDASRKQASDVMPDASADAMACGTGTSARAIVNASKAADSLGVTAQRPLSNNAWQPGARIPARHHSAPVGGPAGGAPASQRTAAGVSRPANALAFCMEDDIDISDL